ncbi:MAG: formate C-acetyltransferase/glycerol dehydratase family glycyl radical enzyme [Dehalococcoidia bacterium]|nr:MAG: formate C-acetyltransferase/glycerol dehydratase family glycyl radical enzyme [Dehalococcoidia bacterium]
MAVKGTKTRERTLDSFPRLSRLHEELLAAKREVCVQRVRYLTEYMRGPDIWFEPPVIRRAKAVAHILRNLEIRIYPDELLVGGISSKRIGAVIYPEFIGLLIWPELEELRTREVDPLEITDEEIRELDEEVFPFWQGKVLADYADQYASPPTPVSLLEKFGFFLLTEAGGISHTAPDIEKLLKVGLQGIIDEASKRIEDIDGSTGADPEELRKRSFYRAVEIACQGLIEYARRCRQVALDLAIVETHSTRKSELTEIARICEKVPAGPAETFHEALQSLWFLQIALHQENYEQALCQGRLDQYLYHYYQRDIENGTLTEERAIELIGCLFIKMSEFVPLFGENIALFFSGLPANPAITIGGVTPDGHDAVNELTYRILETRGLLTTRHPNLHTRVYKNSPDEYLHMTSEVVRKGGGYPALVNDDVILPALMEKGIGIADARDHVIIGCVEISVPRKTFGSTDAALMSLPICLEMALNNGYCPVMLENVGPATGDPRAFKGMDDVIEAFRRQVDYLVEQMVVGLNALSLAHEALYPSPLLSSFIEGCLEKGKDVTAGGAVYNFTGVQGVGVADVADSLAAVDQLVFREKLVSMDELLQALDDDFEGHDNLHRLIMDSVPKYGNDEELPDKYARLAAETFCKEVSKHRNTRGGAYLPGFLTMTTHQGFGKFVGALPSGRKAFETFANGLAPCDGWDVKGPTACLKSIAKLNYSLATNGVAVNIKFHPDHLRGEQGTHIFSSLVRTYFELGGMHLQVNVVDSETLLDAQEHPEKHRGLTVRVAGYSAYFNDLTREVQDEVISRTEHGSR